jgi:dTDP-4-dehydrorhamnose reductase
MRWAVTGAGGMLGADLVEVLESSGHEVIALTRADLDVRDPEACMRELGGVDTVINAAAWTDVDGAEEDEALAFEVNAVGAANVARACSAHSAALVQVSTDYVFDGRSRSPYRVDATMAPINAYGRTKAAAEWAVRANCERTYIVRTAWLFGAHGSSFVATMLNLSSEQEVVQVVADQRGQPTWTVDLARLLRDLIDSGASPGVYHGTSAGDCSWFDLAQKVFSLKGSDPDRVVPATTATVARSAKRPAYSVLANDGRMPDWQDAVSRALVAWPDGPGRAGAS